MFKLRKGISLLIVLLLLSSLLLGCSPENRMQVGEFQDANLESAVREELEIMDGEITEEDLESTTRLVLSGRNIENLAGIEHFTNLEGLNLRDNKITDISYLSGMTKMYDLRLNGNKIVDVSPLTGMTDLGNLYLADNEIADISPLKEMTWLKKLDLRNNYLDLEDSETLAVINALESAGVEVRYESQKERAD